MQLPSTFLFFPPGIAFVHLLTGAKVALTLRAGL